MSQAQGETCAYTYMDNEDHTGQEALLESLHTVNKRVSS